MESEAGSRLLIAYASWTGATREVSERIAARWREAGVAVDVREAGRVRDLRPYAAVVIGNSVHAGKLTRHTIDFSRRFASALAKLPTAWFLVSLTMASDQPDKQQRADAYLDRLRAAAPAVTPVAIGQFAGAILTETDEYRHLFVGMRFIAGKIAARESDHRDWAEIDAWAQGVLPLLLPVRVPA